VEFCEDKGLPWRVIGKGTNLLVLDGGVDEVIINLSSSFQEVEVKEELKVWAGAGLWLARLVKYCQLEGIAGLEFMAGIPGTLGGALVMNAGADKREIADVVRRVSFYRPKEGVGELKRKHLNFSYRGLKKPEGTIFLGAEFSLSHDDPVEIRERIMVSLKRRRTTQPLSQPSPGSIFKNPPGKFAGQLIENAGLKGERIGDAQVSEKHANFIVNRGRARARDVIALIERIKDEVKKQSGVELKEEVEIIGRD